MELAAGRCSCLDVRALWRGDDPLTLEKSTFFDQLQFVLQIGVEGVAGCHDLLLDVGAQ
jgi:hypothetical protein